MNKGVILLSGAVLLLATALSSCNLPTGHPGTDGGGATETGKTGSLQVVVPGTYAPWASRSAATALDARTCSTRLVYTLRSGSRVVASWEVRPEAGDHEAVVSGRGYTCTRDGIPEGSDYTLTVELRNPWMADSLVCIGVLGGVRVIAEGEISVTVVTYPVDCVELPIYTDNNRWSPSPTSTWQLDWHEEKWFRFGPLPEESGDRLEFSIFVPWASWRGFVCLSFFGPDARYVTAINGMNIHLEDDGIVMTLTVFAPAAGHWYACLMGDGGQARIKFNYQYR